MGYQGGPGEAVVPPVVMPFSGHAQSGSYTVGRHYVVTAKTYKFRYYDHHTHISYDFI